MHRMGGLIDFLRQRILRDDLRARRPQAVETLFEELAARLYQYALTITRRQAEAEEVLQDVFVHLVADPERLRGVRDLKAYLYRAVRNRALNQQRNRERETALDESVFELAAPADGADLELEQALNMLPPEQREVVVLKVWQGMTFRDIASVLDIPANTAASRYRYALEHMKRSMTEVVVHA